MVLEQALHLSLVLNSYAVIRNTRLVEGNEAERESLPADQTVPFHNTCVSQNTSVYLPVTHKSIHMRHVA